MGRNLSDRWTGCAGVRSIPKSLLLGLVVPGLPLAIALGWALAGSAPAPAVVPDGAGGLGAAPATSAVATLAGYTSRPPRALPHAVSSASARPVAGPPSARPGSSGPVPVSRSPRPSLPVPPAPTPAEPGATGAPDLTASAAGPTGGPTVAPEPGAP